MNPLETYLTELAVIHSSGGSSPRNGVLCSVGKSPQRNRQDLETARSLYHVAQESRSWFSGRWTIYREPVQNDYRCRTAARGKPRIGSH